MGQAKQAIQTKTRGEAIVMFAAYAQECARDHEIPLMFNNWLRNRRIQLFPLTSERSTFAAFVHWMRGGGAS